MVAYGQAEQIDLRSEYDIRFIKANTLFVTMIQVVVLRSIIEVNLFFLDVKK